MATKISRRDLIVQVQGLTDCVEGAILPALEQGLQRDRELRARVEVLEAWVNAGAWARLKRNPRWQWLFRWFRGEEQ